ncbi:MAG TPA: hypothetical protein VJ914_30060 [Pseudonocardiaceae bacterium]|nr:hypothetical protein [Pseudonocardiaceae bacterium]
MHSLRVGLVIGAASLALLAGCAKAPKATTAQSLPTTTTTTQIAHEWNGTGPGDGPPDAADNELHPKTISPADQAAGDAAATKVKAALTRVQRSGAVTKVTVHNALARAGFNPKEFYAVPAGSSIAFGITVGGACVEGSVDRTKLDAQVQGPVPDWGCGIVGPTH